MKKTVTRQPLSTADVAAKDADDQLVIKITRQIMVEYRVALEALAQSEAEDRETAKLANSK